LAQSPGFFPGATIMKRIAIAAFGLAAIAAPALAQSDAQVRQQIIRQSIAAYPGSCACPYNVDRAGRSCGRRSAYSRPGGHSPSCYPGDVSQSDIEAWRRARR
jgi:hypothetical protein